MMKISQMISMVIAGSMVLLSAPAQATEVMVTSEVNTPHAWQVHTRGGLNVGTFAHELNCTECGRVQANGGPVVGLDALYEHKGILLGLTGELGAIIFSGEQVYTGLLLGQSKDFGLVTTSVFAEVGFHGVHGFVSGMFDHSTHGSDWAILPYAGARFNADLTILKEVDLTLGIWSALRMDLMQREQDIEVNAGLFRNADDTEFRTYRVGGLQAAAGLQLGMNF